MCIIPKILSWLRVSRALYSLTILTICLSSLYIYIFRFFNLYNSVKKCPFLHPGNGTTNSHWWKNNLNIKILNQNNERTDPMPSDFNYATEFGKLDLASLKNDLTLLMTDSQDFWPADVSQ